jgi:hypothetical protein
LVFRSADVRLRRRAGWVYNVLVVQPRHARPREGRTPSGRPHGMSRGQVGLSLLAVWAGYRTAASM